MAWKYDGPITSQISEWRLQRQGYRLEFCCSYCYPEPPSDFIWPGKPETGWAYRRAIASWAKKNGIIDYKILRNTGYKQDLHGIVYECWVNR